MSSYNVNDIINVKISSIVSYGAFVEADNSYTGLIHISEINGEYINDINDFFKIGEMKKAKIIEVDEEKKQLKLTMIGLYNENKDKNKPHTKKLEETKLGFELFNEILPEWIDEKILEMENKVK